MKNHRELISRRIHILTEQAAGARQAGTRVDLIEAQIDGWTHVLRMFDAGTIATSPRVLVIKDTEVAEIATADRNLVAARVVTDTAVDRYITRRLREAHFDLARPFTMARQPDHGGAVEYRQEPMLPCAS